MVRCDAEWTFLSRDQFGVTAAMSVLTGQEFSTKCHSYSLSYFLRVGELDSRTTSSGERGRGGRGQQAKDNAYILPNTTSPPTESGHLVLPLSMLLKYAVWILVGLKAQINMWAEYWQEPAQLTTKWDRHYFGPIFDARQYINRSTHKLMKFFFFGCQNKLDQFVHAPSLRLKSLLIL